jgi:hypothetical protein
MLDGRIHVIHTVEFRESEPRENLHRRFFRSSCTSYEQRLTSHICEMP